MTQLDNNYEADLLDSMADQCEELQEAMRETSQSDWSLIEADGKFIGFTVTNPEQDWEEYDDQA
jgi:hypothetical protein